MCVPNWRHLGPFLVGALLWLVATATHAATWHAVSVTGDAVAGNQDYGRNVGVDFVVTGQIEVTALGVFDSDADGLSGQLRVHLFDLDDTSAALATASLTGNADPLIGQFRYASVDPLVLGPGTYTVFASGFSAQDPNGNRHLGFDAPMAFATAGTQVAYVDGRFGGDAADPTLGFPGLTTVGNYSCGGQQVGCFAAASFTFVTQDTSPVPLPISGGLLLAGIGVLMAHRRRP